MKHMILTKTIAESLIANSALSAREYTSMTTEAAHILARGYRCRSLMLTGTVGRFITTSVLDLSGLTALDAETGAALAEWGHEDGDYIMTLDLSGLTQLTSSLAAALAAWKPALKYKNGGCGLILNGVTHVSAGSLAALAQWNPECLSATISINGLQSLDVTQARAIRNWSGPSEFLQLRLEGVRDISKRAAEELSQWPGECLAIGLRKLTPDVAGALASFNGTMMELMQLTQIDIMTARQLFNTDVSGSTDRMHPNWDLLNLGRETGMLEGVTPEVADWIMDVRGKMVNVELSELAELSVYANCTFLQRLDVPKEMELIIGGKGGVDSSCGVVHCPFCGHEVGVFTKTHGFNTDVWCESADGGDVVVHDLDPETWDEQWHHSPCPHVIGVICGGRPVVKVTDNLKSRASAAGRIRINVTGRIKTSQWRALQNRPL